MAKINEKKITISDVEGSLRALQGGTKRVGDALTPAMPPLLAIAGGLVVVVVFFLGYRKGHKGSAVVEIKRL